MKRAVFSTEIRAWKLFRVRKNGTLGPLFVERGRVLPEGEWLEANLSLPPRDLAKRPGWHACLSKPPHLKTTEGRVWKRVLLKNYYGYTRPPSQGGLWVIGTDLFIVKEGRPCTETP